MDVMLDIVFKILFTADDEDSREALRLLLKIFFLNCVLFPESDKVPRRYFAMEEDEHDRLSPNLEIIFYEMPKLDRVVKAYFEGKTDLKNLPKEQKWCIFFRYKNNKKIESLIQELCRQEEGIMRADRALARISRDQQKWARVFSREVGIIDHEFGLYAAKKAGEERGFAKGMEHTARSLKTQGVSPEIISNTEPVKNNV
ncbi:hypothetical protein AGMMS49579_23820 [Spirochaetia bacterium]|nr:hypothetical protein AGMMS49579_23820 [Spirochaetia bacterium]